MEKTMTDTTTEPTSRRVSAVQFVDDTGHDVTDEIVELFDLAVLQHDKLTGDGHIAGVVWFDNGSEGGGVLLPDDESGSDVEDVESTRGANIEGLLSAYISRAEENDTDPRAIMEISHADVIVTAQWTGESIDLDYISSSSERAYALSSIIFTMGLTVTPTFAPEPPTFPELEKQSAAHDSASLIRDFLDSIAEKGLGLANEDENIYGPDLDKLLADYFGYDLTKVEAERQALLKQLSR
jgi:hypothetical protein